MPRPQGKCIFCSKGNISKQHIWPDWLKTILPRTRMKQYQIRMKMDFRSSATTFATEPIITSRQGDPGTRKVHKVCRSCNSGWMSGLESRAKPILTPLINDASFTLYPSAQTVVSAWAAMTLITAEFDNPKTVAVPLSDREWLMNNGQPPKHWRIWLGRYRGKHGNTWFRHHGFSFSPPPDIPVSIVNPVIVSSDEPCNAQVTTLITGALLLHAFSTRVSFVRFDEVRYAKNLGLWSIWPGTGKPIVWNDLPVLGEADAEAIANTLTEAFP